MDFSFKQSVPTPAPLPRQHPVLTLPPSSLCPSLSLCTSYSNRNLIFQAIVVFLLPYFYCCCCCCLEDHRLPLYADAPSPPPPSPSLSLSFCISICRTLSCSPSLSACLSSSALRPHPLLLLTCSLLYFFTPSHPSCPATPSSPPAFLLSVYLLFHSSAVRATDSDGSQMVDGDKHGDTCMQLHAHTHKCVRRPATARMDRDSHTHICAKAHTPANTRMHIQFFKFALCYTHSSISVTSLSQFGREDIALGAQSYQKTECRKY